MRSSVSFVFGDTWDIKLWVHLTLMGSFEIYHGFTILRVIFSTLLSARVDHVKRHLCQLLEFEIVEKILILHLWLRFPLNETSLKIVLKWPPLHWMRFPLNETPLTIFLNSLQNGHHCTIEWDFHWLRHLWLLSNRSRNIWSDRPTLQDSLHWSSPGAKSSIFYHFPGGF